MGLGEAGLGHQPWGKGQDKVVMDPGSDTAPGLKIEVNSFAKMISEAKQLAQYLSLSCICLYANSCNTSAKNTTLIVNA